MQKLLVSLLLCLHGTLATAQTWGEPFAGAPEVYATPDVSADTVELVKYWHGVAAEAWGNWGPLEIYIVGTDEAAAKALEDDFCTRHKALDDQWSLKWDCASERHKIFRQMVTEGGASVSTYRKAHLSYDFFTLKMGSLRPYPDEEDYKQTVLHEYWHVFQNAQISDRRSDDSKVKKVRNEKLTGDVIKRPWLLEGSATFMALVLYSDEVGHDRELRRQMLRYSKRSLSNYLKSSMKLHEFTYEGEERRMAYDIGAWFTAYLVHNEGVEALKDGFYGDLDSLGFAGSFEKNFGQSPADYVEEFNEFMRKNRRNIKALTGLFLE